MVRSRAHVSDREHRALEQLLLYVEVVLHDVVVHFGVVGSELRAARQSGIYSSAAKRIWNRGKYDFGDVINRRIEQIRDDRLHFQRQIRERSESSANRGLLIAED